MRKIKEVLRLSHEHGLSDRQIAVICGIARSTVGKYLMRAQAAGITWPVTGLDDAAIEAQLFPAREPKAKNHLRSGHGNQPRPMPNFAEMHKELQTHKHVTLQLLWQEYKQANANGYQYSQFCERYRKWAKKTDLVLRQTHRAGEKLFVDYAGQTVPVIDAKTGDEQSATVFVAVLGASNYTYMRTPRCLLIWSRGSDRMYERWTTSAVALK